MCIQYQYTLQRSFISSPVTAIDSTIYFNLLTTIVLSVRINNNMVYQNWYKPSTDSILNIHVELFCLCNYSLARYYSELSFI